MLDPSNCKNGYTSTALVGVSQIPARLGGVSISFFCLSLCVHTSYPLIETHTAMDDLLYLQPPSLLAGPPRAPPSGVPQRCYRRRHHPRGAARSRGCGGGGGGSGDSHHSAHVLLRREEREMRKRYLIFTSRRSCCINAVSVPSIFSLASIGDPLTKYYQQKIITGI